MNTELKRTDRSVHQGTEGGHLVELYDINSQGQQTPRRNEHECTQQQHNFRREC
jgi:hypothetical protein